LFELLLVIGVLSVVMAMAWPAFDRMMDARRLGDGATRLRSVLRDARRSAIQDGIAYRVDYLPGSLQLRIVPETDDLSGESAESPVAIGSAVAQTPEFEPTRVVSELPLGVRLVSQEEFDAGPADKEKDGPAEALDPADETSPGDDSSSDEWKPLAAFFSDGSAVETVCRLVDENRQVVELRIVGITGEVEIGEAMAWRTAVNKSETLLSTRRDNHEARDGSSARVGTH
jgi:type II secretory pathway pseudopilin PulG